MTLLDLSTAERVMVANNDVREIIIGGQRIWTRPVLYTNWAEQRRNFVRSPTGADLTYYGATVGTLTNPAGEIVWTRNATGAARALEVQIGTDIGTGLQVTLKCEIMTPNSGTVALRTAVANSAGALALDPNTFAALPDVWQTFEGTATIPATGWVPTATAGFVFVITAGVAGAVVRYRNFQVEKRVRPLGEFFTGSSVPADPVLQRYRWTGPVNGSASVYETREVKP